MIESRFFHFFLLSLGTAIILGCAAIGTVRVLERSAYIGLETQFVYIEAGQGIGRTAKQIQSLGFVRAPWQFKAIVRMRGQARSLYAGEYAVPQGHLLTELLSDIKAQKTYQRRVSIPEGMSNIEIDAVLRASFGLDLEGMRLPPEGRLLPDTYFYERGDKASSLLARMEKAQAEALRTLWDMRAPDLPISSPEEALVLASIVEKETALASERPMVAAVFVNRLKKGMRLQSDPTVIYGITSGGPLGRAITRADLRQKTAYNTYRVNGLPPTPIANPGYESIAAVLNPASVPYLYFVADGSGGHAFAATLDEHNRNVARWRRLERGES